VERLRQKRPRLALNREEYGQLKTDVLNRDGWRCQCYGLTMNLQVHHLHKRSQLGSDAADNLITLCASCQGRQHNII